MNENKNEDKIVKKSNDSFFIKWLKTFLLIVGLLFWAIAPLYLTIKTNSINDKLVKDVVNLMWWVIGFNALLVMPIFLGFVISFKEVYRSFQRFYHKMKGNKHICIKFIYSNMVVGKIYALVKDSVYEYDRGKPFFLNPKKSVKEDGYITYYKVLNNAFAHDFNNSKDKILDSMFKSCKKISMNNQDIPDLSNEMYDFDEPYKTDAALVQQWAIQQTLAERTDTIDQLVHFLRKPNILIMLAIVAIIALIAAIAAIMVYYQIVDVPLCSTGVSKGVLKV